mmetsp:Transcript_112784/g.318860  ORF Transcript_112784/g.318860 Transcript_112784/m.318860 type:complete len:352 (-) Transcript_112784:1236-2291(-)
MPAGRPQAPRRGAAHEAHGKNLRAEQAGEHRREGPKRDGQRLRPGSGADRGQTDVRAGWRGLRGCPPEQRRVAGAAARCAVPAQELGAPPADLAEVCAMSLPAELAPRKQPRLGQGPGTLRGGLGDGEPVPCPARATPARAPCLRHCVRHERAWLRSSPREPGPRLSRGFFAAHLLAPRDGTVPGREGCGARVRPRGRRWRRRRCDQGHLCETRDGRGALGWTPPGATAATGSGWRGGPRTCGLGRAAATRTPPAPDIGLPVLAHRPRLPSDGGRDRLRSRRSSPWASFRRAPHSRPAPSRHDVHVARREHGLHAASRTGAAAAEAADAGRRCGGAAAADAMPSEDGRAQQ